MIIPRVNTVRKSCKCLICGELITESYRVPEHKHAFDSFWIDIDVHCYDIHLFNLTVEDVLGHTDWNQGMLSAWMRTSLK